jgi:hypothetical protein
MVDLKISMSDGTSYNVRNQSFNTPKEWIRGFLMPHGNQLVWCEILADKFIQTSQIVSVRKLSSDEVEVLKIQENSSSPGPEESEAKKIVLPPGNV